MFLQYTAPGAFVPLFSLRLQELGFTPVEIGWSCATQSLAALVGPLVVGHVADRWWPAERCLVVCGVVAAALLWVLAGLTKPWAVFGVCLVFWLFLGSATMLGTAVSLTPLPFPARDFGRVRLWGTVGWVLPGCLLAYWFGNPDWLCGWVAYLRPESPRSELSDIFRLASLCALFLAAYALTLPAAPRRERRHESTFALFAALRLLHDRSFAVYLVGSLGACLSIALMAQGTPLLLEQLGMPRPWLPPSLTLSQGAEVICLALLPVLLRRVGVRGTMLVGLAAGAFGLAVFALGGPLWLAVAALATWGLLVCCYIVAGQVFVNGRARDGIRATAQALLTCTNGVGLLVGNLLGGWVRKQVNGELAPMFAVGAVIAAGLVVTFFLGFTPNRPAEQDE